MALVLTALTTAVVITIVAIMFLDLCEEWEGARQRERQQRERNDFRD